MSRLLADMRSFLYIPIISVLSCYSDAFSVPKCPSRNGMILQRTLISLAASTTTSSTTVTGAKETLETMLVDKNGKVGIEVLEPYLKAVESRNTYKEPNREANYKGTWHVWYSNAPPPSNGQLGPFQGSAEQAIAIQGDSYKNVLRLPPNSSDDAWLTVVLDGIWEDWDGQEIQENGVENAAAATAAADTGSKSRNDPDWGAKFWKVTFLRLNFILFGKQLLSKDFPAGVARVWRTTYLDDETRIVRAGRTGRVEDESIFYMKRTPRPLSS